MGKSEPPPQRFRRKAKSPASSSASSELSSNSTLSPQSTVDTLLCNNLLDSNTTSELSPPSPEPPPPLSQDLSTANGPCDVDLTDTDVKGSESSLIRDNGVVDTDDVDKPGAVCLSSHLPAELSGLCCSEITPLCSDQSLHLSACHVQTDDSLVFVFFIHNSSDSDVQQMSLELDSDQLEVCLLSCMTLSVMSFCFSTNKVFLVILGVVFV